MPLKRDIYKGFPQLTFRHLRADDWTAGNATGVIAAPCVGDPSELPEPSHSHCTPSQCVGGFNTIAFYLKIPLIHHSGTQEVSPGFLVTNPCSYFPILRGPPISYLDERRSHLKKKRATAPNGTVTLD